MTHVTAHPSNGLVARAATLSLCLAILIAPMAFASSSNADAPALHHAAGYGYHALRAERQRAVAVARDYVESVAGVSAENLIAHLRSVGVSRFDAVFAANHVDANWSREAVQAARLFIAMSRRLDLGAATRAQVVHHLESHGFTPAQAAHGARIALANR